MYINILLVKAKSCNHR